MNGIGAQSVMHATSVPQQPIGSIMTTVRQTAEIIGTLELVLNRLEATIEGEHPTEEKKRLEQLSSLADFVSDNLTRLQVFYKRLAKLTDILGVKEK